MPCRRFASALSSPPFWIEAEHVQTIVRRFDADRDGFMVELRRWLQSRGISVTTVLALALADAEAQRLPAGSR